MEVHSLQLKNENSGFTNWICRWFLKIMQGFAVNVNQQQCEIIGRVCMDQMIISVPDDVKEGDEVILIDNNLNSSQAVEALAAKQNTINYEVLCNLGRRLPRIYYLNKNLKLQMNY